MQDTDSNASTDSMGRRGEERAWAAHMAGLRASYHRHLVQHPAKKDLRIEALLDQKITDAPENWRNWEIPNEIEILLVQLKLGPDLDVALDSAFLTAEKILVPSFGILNKRRDGTQSDEVKQALLAKLLRDTHNRYAARRSERAERALVAKRMTYLGFGLTGVIVGVFLVLGTGWFAVAVEKMPFTDLVKYNLIVTTFFGFLGAYLSRLIAFQNTAVKLSVDDLENGYSWHFLMVRLLVGGLSSVILYFVISGHLIGGELFPAPENGATGGFGDLWTVHNGDGMPYEGPSANFAKLIVWCFIAGFSERFLPDSLSALEAKSRG
ncbi:MAG: hypothetical protein FD150_920 [Rhodobacteraceae bacterium]|nr:MAG: hypothetical protein FD150_920 [Paracoccaceae bacterium]